ncbi:MAG: phosphatase PAP2 family protein [Planctomycetales bacterium]|nr:phosphatase PAP2 family protein [bacterium]UNM07801.1 MAG: phosphatase PAP2 family protein [Planctomycetales bacterium]
MAYRLVILLSMLVLCSLRPALAAPGDSTEVRFARTMGDEGTIAFLSAAMLVPLIQKGEAGEGQALRTGDAIAASLIASEGLKLVVRSDRPDGHPGYSFPSNHATMAFAAATVAADHDPDQALLWYGGASLIAWSRVRENRHRTEDVLAGAALGYGIAKLEQQLPRGILISPFFNPEGHGGGVDFIVNF